MNKKKVKRIAVLVLTIITGGFFFLAGQAKFTGIEIWAKMFERWGYPSWFQFVVGGAEVIVAILLFFPKFKNKAAIAGIVIMLGAVATHLFNDQSKQVLSPFLYIVFFAAILLVNRDWSKTPSVEPTS